ncbi:MAG: helix-turn-helix domain-containing protein [Bryobacteraceae bacterium]|jgi:excisionase family DNA binding protein
MKVEANPQYLRTADVATRLGVSPCFITKAIRTGQLNSVKLGRARLIPASAVDAYILQAQTVGR